MRLYVTGAWSDHAAVGALMRRLEAAGHTMVLDWTRLDMPQAGGADAEERLAAMAERLFDALGTADAVLALLSEPTGRPYRGVFYELGVAAGRGIPALIISQGNATVSATGIYPRVPVLHLNPEWSEAATAAAMLPFLTRVRRV
jgi:nucleoside 2-deoxyribosyltransferase